MLKGFKDFIMRGNVVDLAVGIVIGAAFTSVVTALTNGFLQPVLKRLGGGQGVHAGGISIGGGQYLDWTLFVNALINFLIVAAALYFLVVFPMNVLAERRRRGEEPPPKTPSEEVQLLTEIRDALLRQNGVPPEAGPGRTVPVYPADSPRDLRR